MEQEMSEPGSGSLEDRRRTGECEKACMSTVDFKRKAFVCLNAQRGAVGNRAGKVG